MRRTDTQRETDRGQAYTLEGFVAAAIVLLAVLLAMQAIVITPGTSGAVDRTTQTQVQQQTQDALVVAAHAEDGDGSLSELVRSWPVDEPVSQQEFENQSVLGTTLGEHISETTHPQGYRVEFAYLNESDTETEWIAGSNITDESAVTASYTITLFNEQNMTEYNDGDGEFEKTDDLVEDSEIPEADNGSDPIYNVVEVRVTVW
ncbi:hypothetical protein ACLI4Z_11680 [Natrialbaceae archaeon A-arb3/5]